MLVVLFMAISILFVLAEVIQALEKQRGRGWEVQFQ